MDYQHIEHQWIPAADGVRLSARLWIPHGGSRLPPVVLEYIPYRKRDSYRIHDSAWGHGLASNGIAFARVDVRGSGDSEGVVDDEYTDQEIADGLQVIDWLAQQPWNNGRVGIRGISWGAINALQIAARQPTALAAVMAIAGSDHRYADDAHYVGGLYGRANVEWGVLCKSVLASPPDPEVTGERWQQIWLQRLDAISDLIGRWSRHQNFDDYWQRGSVALDYQRITVPVYVVAGLLDTYANPLGRLLVNLLPDSIGLLGCWGHTYPDTAQANGLDWLPEEVRWWRRWLDAEAGNDNKANRESLWCFVPDQPPVRALPESVPGSWRAVSDRALSDPDTRVFQLAPGALLESKHSSQQPFEYVSSGRPGQSRVDWLNTLPLEQSADDMLALIFDSEVLTQPLPLLGHARLRFTAEISTAAAGIWVRLNEVTEDGRSWPISHFVGSLNRALDNQQPQAFQPGRACEFTLPLTFTAHQFQPGSRIRLALSDAPWPMTLALPAARWRMHPAGAELTIPVLADDDSSGAFPLYAKQGRDPDSETPRWRQAADGSVTVDHVPSSYEYTDREVGTRLSGNTTGRSEIDAEGRTRYLQTSTRGWQRDSWRCELDCGCELKADQSTLVICEWVEARCNGEVIFQRRHETKLPRQLL